MSDRLKILFAGLGSIGQRHVRNLRALLGDGVDILAYRVRRQTPALNPDMSTCPAVDPETAYNIRCFDTLEAALEQRPDAVFVTNPNTLHLSVALAAARAGCHLFIEKPLSHSLEHADELIELVERKQLVALVAYQFRFHPGLRLMKSIIENGRLGKLIAAHIVNGEYLPDWHPYEDYRESHAARRELGGGCLSIQTHELDYALWLFGTPKRIYAVGGHLSELEVNVEDSVSILLHCDFGGNPLPVHVHLDYLQRPPQRICEVVGDAGKARYDYYGNQVELHATGTAKVEVQRFDDFDRNQMFLDELRHFLACLRGEAKPLLNLREAKRSMRISLDAAHSLRSGLAIDCESN
jgi:predicted dehydrogenase